MIPYSILSGVLVFIDKQTLPFRVLDLSPDEFTFRLIKKYDHHKISGINLQFYNFETDSFITCELTDFEVLSETSTSTSAFESFYTFYRVKTTQIDYFEQVNHLSAFYMHYIRLKLSSNDAELTEDLMGYPSKEEESFPENIESFRKQHFNSPLRVNDNAVQKKINCSQIALSLNTPSLLNTFIKMPFPEFIQMIEEKFYLGMIPLHNFKITHIYIGHPSNFELFPALNALSSVIIKTRKLHLHPVMVIPPLRGQKLDQMQIFINEWIKLFSINDQTSDFPEFVINDWGIAIWIHKHYGKNCRIILGTLLNKRRKDVRILYKNHNEKLKHLLLENTSNADFYRQELRNIFGICSYAYDSTGYLVTIPEGHHELHIPYYIMNTEGFDTNCIRLYPLFLPMIGVDGTLWGLDTKLFKDSTYIEMLLAPEISRIVLEVI